MASTITAGNATNGLALSCDNTGILELKTGTGSGTTAITADASQNVTVAGTLTAPSVIPSSSTVPTNGVFLPAANTLGFSTASTERARIDSSGNLLVNRTSGLGSAKFVVEADTTTANPMTVSNSRSTAATDYSILFYRNAALVGSVQTTLSATSYVTTSDYRLKENVQPITGALAKVSALKPCTYTWKSTGEVGEGFIAHELAEVCPSAVTGEKDAVNEDGSIKPQGIDTSFLVATLTAALQEAHGLIKDLQSRVGALEAK